MCFCWPCSLVYRWYGGWVLPELLVLCRWLLLAPVSRSRRECSPREQQFLGLSTLSTTTRFVKCPKICNSSPLSSKRSGVVVRAMSGESASQGLPIDLRGKRAFIAGVADDNGYGWAIAKALAAAGAEIFVGTWVPALNIFETSLRRGKFDESRKSNQTKDMLEHQNELLRNAESVKNDYGSIDILVHSLANGPEVTKPLLETSRRGYLAAISASCYSFVVLASLISLTHIVSERAIPGYGGGMSSAKAALESDTRVLAFEAGRKGQSRVNTISAGPLGSRAAKAIGFIEKMIEYSYVNAPLQKELLAGKIAFFSVLLRSGEHSCIPVYVDNGLNTMGLAVDSPTVTS
ncbi:hypothetical protein EJB05_49848, partial [Eragrostis curvula]